ncbi:WD40/YVTN/BNR-like repeat-containing protein [Massilia sp. S19_KUP03_FR1]|uniref:WD40/YVTN/BNR-like repeat-containing protein n=1 Tax=Massilia sp. S19_KUP03_FR1 TaxID=3025503 RepID=UPI002FCCBBE4
MHLRTLPLFLLPCLAAFAAEPAWQAQDSGVTVELRGLSVVSAKVAWASGANGTVIRTVDGAHWAAVNVPDAGAIDLRDIHALDADTAIAMGAGTGAASRIYRTTDGGASWKSTAINAVAAGFWDALAFWDARRGLLLGDPVDGVFQVYTTGDGGLSWQARATRGLEALAGEGAFAASGTCLSVAGSNDAWIVSGSAAQARAFHSADGGISWQAALLPIAAAAPSRGAFSVAFLDRRTGMAAGGDYRAPKLDTGNGARSTDGGATWQAASILPSGFMSVLATVPGAPRAIVAAGLAGSGYSLDAGLTWTELGSVPMNTVGFASGTAGWAVGPKGLVMAYRGPVLR